MDWQEATDVKQSIIHITQILDFPHIQLERIYCYRTEGSKARAYARTWSFPKIFQKALGVEAAYVIEVLSKHYDKLHEDAKKKVLIHELLHIPKNFSGALLPHHTAHRNLEKTANQLFKDYQRKTK